MEVHHCDTADLLHFALVTVTVPRLRAVTVLTNPPRARLRGSLASYDASVSKLECHLWRESAEILRGLLVPWPQCRNLSTTHLNAINQSLGACHRCLFSGLIEYCFPLRGGKIHTHTQQHTHTTHTHAQAFVTRIGSITSICRFESENEASVRIESIILSIFRAKTIDYRFQFLPWLWYPYGRD